MTTTYPTHPGSKVSGPSREAAQAERSRAATLRDLVMMVLNRSQAGFTADECASLVGATILSIRPRLSELVKMGRIEDTGIRRKNASGHNATVWASKRVYSQKELL